MHFRKTPTALGARVSCANHMMCLCAVSTRSVSTLPMVCALFLFSYLLHHAISNCLTLSLFPPSRPHPLTAADAIRRNSNAGKRNQNKTRDVGISCFSVVLVVESKSPDHAVLCYTVGYNCFCCVSRRRNTIPTTTRRQTYVCPTHTGEACFNSVPGPPP